MKERIKSILITPIASIRDAMLIIEKAPHTKEPAPSGLALVVDKEYKLLGIVTDGDIRRAILNNIDIKNPVEKIMNRNPVTIKKGLSAFDMFKKIIDEIKERKIADKKLDKIIVVDDDNKIYDVLSFFEIWRSTEIKTRNICIVGLGYVGLTLALVLADVGFKVFGVDLNKDILDSLKKGEPHFHEIGLKDLLRKHLNKNFFVEEEFKENQSDVYIIAVDTPVDEKGRVLTNSLENAVKAVTKVLKPHDLIILRSTVPVGACQDLVIPIIEKETKLKAGEDFYFAFAPERTIEGKALDELRILPQVIGGYNKTSVDLASKLFESITGKIVPVSSLEAAEMVKLLNNTFRDLSFAYANEVAQICERFNLNSFKVINAANEGYPRNPIPTPSPGVGGPCLTKDPYIFIESAKKVGYEPQLSKLSREINKNMIDFVAKKVYDFCQLHNISHKQAKIFILGIAFKGHPETSDIRNSTSLDILFKLQDSFPNIFVYDPVVDDEILREKGLSPISLDDGFSSAHCVLILNNHISFKDFDIYNFLKTMNKPGLFFDAWNLFPEEIINGIEGIKYSTLGK